jgi:2,3-bisphosphoglycerate-dependent phosphoglycerate mutase
MKTRFIVVRHGETQWNVESRIQGHMDSPLTEKGVQQAEAIAARLAKERFDVLVSSDLGLLRCTRRGPSRASAAMRWSRTRGCASAASGRARA